MNPSREGAEMSDSGSERMTSPKRANFKRACTSCDTRLNINIKNTRTTYIIIVYEYDIRSFKKKFYSAKSTSYF